MGKPVWSDSNPETLSAFMDGEAPDDAHGPLLKALKTDPELQQRWSRYHLLSDAIRNNLPPALLPDLGARIQHALESEPVYLLPRQDPAQVPVRTGKRTGARILQRTARQAGGWALAASVTAVTILGVQAFNAGPTPNGASLAGADGTTTTPYSTLLPSEGGSPLTTMTSYPPARASNLPSPRVMDKFNQMWANHNAYVAGTPVQGMPSYVRLVNFESGR